MNVRIENILSDDNLHEAMQAFDNKTDSCGIDGVRVSELRTFWEANGKKVKQAIYDGSYAPGLIKQYEIVNEKRKKRTISVMNTVDRFIYRALMQEMNKIWEPCFSDNSYAYRENKGIKQAVERAGLFIEQGLEWCVEIDIEKFFDNINQTILLTKLQEYISDSRVLNLLIGYLRCTVINDHIIRQCENGILQGGPISPLLSNIYLNELDHYMDKSGYYFCRFGDDINIYCKSYVDAFEQYQTVKSYLESNEHLKLNIGKSGVYKAINRKYLGYRFSKENGKVIIRREQKAYRTVYRDWYTTGITRLDHNYHLINEGILTKKDYTILFNGEDGKKYIPVETTDSLYIYSNVIFSENFFEFANIKGLNISIIDRYGEKVGTFVPQNNRKNIKTEIKQIKLYEDETARLTLARSLEIAGMSNMRANLRYYMRRKPHELLEKTISSLTRLIQQLNETKNITGLMTIEAQAKQQYYRCFNVIMNDSAFTFTKRTKRPPEDPLNAMISFGNTLLYQRLANEINRTSLDIRIGIVHAANSRPESLNLDLADLFKPILVDRTIFTLVNRKMLDSDDFVEVEKNGIYLSKTGKRQFLQEFERKLYQKIQYDGVEHTYDYVMKREIQSLKKFIEHGDKYKC